MPTPTLPIPSSSSGDPTPGAIAARPTDLLTDFLNPAFSLPDLAARHALSLSDLAAKLTSPDFVAALHDIAALNTSRAQLLALSHAPVALGALGAICAASKPISARSASTSPPASPPPSPSLNARILEITRKSATSILQLTRSPLPTPTFQTRATTPPMQYPGGHVAPTPPSSPALAGKVSRAQQATEGATMQYPGGHAAATPPSLAQPHTPSPAPAADLSRAQQATEGALPLPPRPPRQTLIPHPSFPPPWQDPLDDSSELELALTAPPESDAWP